MAVISIRGPIATGKSAFALGWRQGEKHFVFDLEFGADRALILFPDWKDWVEKWTPFDVNPDDLISKLTKERGEQLSGKTEYYNTIMKKYVEVMQREDIVVDIVDTWKELWQANTQCHLEFEQRAAVAKGNRPRQNLMQEEYGTPNSRMGSTVQVGKAYHKDLILISHERPNYVSVVDGRTGEAKSIEDPSGKVVLDGWKDTEKMSDWSFRMTKDAPCLKPIEHLGMKEDKPVCPGFHFYLEILKSPIGQELVGKRITDPTFTKLDNLAKQLTGRSIREV